MPSWKQITRPSLPSHAHCRIKRYIQCIGLCRLVSLPGYHQAVHLEALRQAAQLFRQRQEIAYGTTPLIPLPPALPALRREQGENGRRGEDGRLCHPPTPMPSIPPPHAVLRRGEGAGGGASGQGMCKVQVRAVETAATPTRSRSAEAGASGRVVIRPYLLLRLESSDGVSSDLAHALVGSGASASLKLTHMPRPLPSPARLWRRARGGGERRFCSGRLRRKTLFNPPFPLDVGQGERGDKGSVNPF